MAKRLNSVMCSSFRVILVLWVSCLVVLPGNAQPGVRLDSVSKRIYQTALRSGDYNQAVQALQTLIALDAKSTYRDSLVRIYFQLQQPVQALYWAQELLGEGSPDSLVLQEIQARSLTALNEVPKAIVVWEQLTARQPGHPSYWWELGKAQYSIRRQAEALSTIARLETLKVDSSMQVPYTTRDSQQWYYTSMGAAAQNLKGLILYELKQLDQAGQAFSKALQLDPKYREAELNLAALNIERQKDKKTTNGIKAKPSKG